MCGECEAIFLTAAELEKHTKRHNFCSICKAEFSSKSEADRHRSNHFRCQLCNYDYKTAFNLKRHMEGFHKSWLKHFAAFVILISYINDDNVYVPVFMLNSNLSLRIDPKGRSVKSTTRMSTFPSSCSTWRCWAWSHHTRTPSVPTGQWSGPCTLTLVLLPPRRSSFCAKIFSSNPFFVQNINIISFHFQLEEGAVHGNPTDPSS